MTLQDAIDRGDIVEFRKFCETMPLTELKTLWIKVKSQPALSKTAWSILLRRLG